MDNCKTCGSLYSHTSPDPWICIKCTIRDRDELIKKKLSRKTSMENNKKSDVRDGRVECTRCDGKGIISGVIQQGGTLTPYKEECSECSGTTKVLCDHIIGEVHRDYDTSEIVYSSSSEKLKTRIEDYESTKYNFCSTCGIKL